MLLKVLNGTKEGSCVSLCLSCRHATVITGQNDTILDCAEISSDFNGRLSKMQPIVKCTYYDDKRMPSISAMREIAWTLEPNKKSGTLGFHQPKKPACSFLNPVSGKDEW